MPATPDLETPKPIPAQLSIPQYFFEDWECDLNASIWRQQADGWYPDESCQHEQK